ncbi:MAG: HAD-IB family hydrolase [Spirochaetales bacterium]|nr:HAD-IB family hydrolase [Spirochaetales bacterium]
MPGAPKPGAFFDIDGTLYRDSLMIEHFKKLLKYEVLDEALWHSNVKQTYENWQKRRGNYDDYMLELADIYVESLKGLEKSKMDFISDQVIDLIGDKVYMYTRNRIEWHEEMNHAVFFISGSPDYLVHRMAERYGATDSVGSRYLLDDEGRYTGEVEKMWDSDSKDEALTRLVIEYNIDLSASYAYGDTNGDLSMFHRVGNPIAINPTRELLSHLKSDPDLSRRVGIAVERKDVVYLLKPDADTFQAYG